MVYLWQSSWCLTLNSKLLPTFLVFVSVDLFPISYNDISQHEHEAPSPTDSLHGLHAHIGVGLGSSIVIKRRHRQVVTPKFGSRFKSGGERPSIVLFIHFIGSLYLVWTWSVCLVAGGVVLSLRHFGYYSCPTFVCYPNAINGFYMKVAYIYIYIEEC